MLKLKIGSTAIWAVVVLTIAFGAFYFKPWVTKPPQTISVSASGTAKAVPNVAKITATIETKNPNIELARELNDTKVSAVIVKLTGAGIDKKDIKTQNISAGQAYEVTTTMYPAPPKPSTNSYSTSLEVTIRNFDSADSIIQTLTQNGATNLYGPNLTVDDATLDAAKSEARKKAVENGKTKAQELADASGRKIGKAVKIQEQGDYGYPVPMMAVGGADLREKASSIQPGQDEVSITVQVDFELK